MNHVPGPRPPRLGPPPEGPTGQVGVGVLRICASDKFPGVAGAAGGDHTENYGMSSFSVVMTAPELGIVVIVTLQGRK